MAMKKSGLGRGLGSLLSDNTIENEETLAPVSLLLTEIEPNKEQARKEFNEEALTELASSIEKHGVLQPLLVKPLPGGGYQLIAGERRWRAARIAGLTKVPVIIKDLSEDEAAVISLIENLQREDLNPVEEAEGYKSLIDTFGLTHEEISEKVGKSRAAVTNALRITTLPATALEMLKEGKISVGHAKVLLSLKDEEKINACAALIKENDWSVRATETYVKKLLKPQKEAVQAPAKAKRDTVYDEIELSLFESCGLKAKVEESKKGEGGTITIEFYSKEQLMDIVKNFEAKEADQ